MHMVADMRLCAWRWHHVLQGWHCSMSVLQAATRSELPHAAGWEKVMQDNGSEFGIGIVVGAGAHECVSNAWCLQLAPTQFSVRCPTATWQACACSGVRIALPLQTSITSEWECCSHHCKHKLGIGHAWGRGPQAPRPSTHPAAARRCSAEFTPQAAQKPRFLGDEHLMIMSGCPLSAWPAAVH